LHDTPLYEIPPQTLTGALAESRKACEIDQIGNEIARAIIDDGRYSDHCYLLDDPEFDWAAAKTRVETVMAKYH
jgi:hypothetical protein